MGTTPASTKRGKEDLEEQDILEISSSLLGGETIKEILKDDKNAGINLEEEVSSYTKSKNMLQIYLFIFLWDLSQFLTI